MLKTFDTEIFSFINKELVRQQENIELIASENIVSQNILEAQGSILTNKYAEGLQTEKRRYLQTTLVCMRRIMKHRVHLWKNISQTRGISLECR